MPFLSGAVGRRGLGQPPCARAARPLAHHRFLGCQVPRLQDVAPPRSGLRVRALRGFRPPRAAHAKHPFVRCGSLDGDAWEPAPRVEHEAQARALVLRRQNERRAALESLQDRDITTDDYEALLALDENPVNLSSLSLGDYLRHCLVAYAPLMSKDE